MINKFNILDNKSKGIALAFFGVLLLTPDTLFMRLSELEKWQLGGWRGVLMGATLFLIWLFSRRMGQRSEFLTTFSIPGLLIIAAMAINSVSFTLGISETSVIVVLTALATMPLLTALLSVLVLREQQNLISWLILIFAVCGIFLAVSGSETAENAPNGSIILGATYGLISALGISFTFTMVRKYPSLSVMPATAIGCVISGVFCFYLSSEPSLNFSAPFSVIVMGIIILPFSFALLLIAPKYTRASNVSLIMLLELVLGSFWVWLVIDEQPSLQMIIGALIVMISIIAYIRISDIQNN
ncbi:DMT family transporter [Paracoccaceae bacterium]|nr:DMT family transporter [Paracoccaceae bacterium]